MSGGALDALLGMVQSKGVEVELLGGLNFAGGLRALPDEANEIIVVSLDPPTLLNKGNAGEGLSISLSTPIQKVGINTSTTIDITPGDAGVFYVEFMNDGVGGHTLEITGVTWSTAEPPIFNEGAGHVNIVQFLNDGTTVFASLWP